MRKEWLVVSVVLILLPMAAVARAQEDATGSEAPSSRQISYFDWFAKGGQWVGYILIGLSVVSTALIIEHFIKIRRSVILPESSKRQIQQMLEQRQYRELVSFTAGDSSLLSAAMSRALAEAPFGYAAMEQAMENALHERQARLTLKPEILNILGNTGPLIGLYGTVLGIILAFSDIVRIGGIPDPGELAGSIGVALVATFWGLTVAIPSLVVYSLMKNRIEMYGNEALETGREFLASFRAATRRKPETDAPKRPAVPVGA